MASKLNSCRLLLHVEVSPLTAEKIEQLGKDYGWYEVKVGKSRQIVHIAKQKPKESKLENPTPTPEPDKDPNNILLKPWWSLLINKFIYWWRQQDEA